MKAYIGLGSNQGNRSTNLKNAIDQLSGLVKINKQSSVYKTEPIGYKDQPEFLNMVLEIETNIKARELLKFTKDIEKKIGRKPTFKNGPRVIDIDILLYGNTKVKSDDLVLPHPQLKKRAFVLKPLLEIAPELKLSDGRKVKDIEMPAQEVKLLLR